MTKYEVEFLVRVELDIHNEDIVNRVLGNHDDQGNPSTDGKGWKDTLYDLDEVGVAEMLAYNVGIKDRRLDSLDGWADCSWVDIDASVDVTLESVYKDGAFLQGEYF